MTTRRKTLEQFIIDAIKIHGYKYDYSLVKYINNVTKVIIICPIHGKFEQTPKMHLKGQGCKNCGIIKRSKSKTKTEEQFIEESNIIHNNFYGYPLVDYISNKIKVKIICPIHGEFLQTPSSHLNGCGCPKCVGKNKTTEEYIKSVMIVHNNKYDYPLVDYIGNKIKIKIICPIHGIFEQRPIDHLRGHGCKKCADLEKSYSLRYTTDEYKEVVNKKHNNKYDYSLTNYTDCYSKIKIICPIHGIFEQVAHSHLSGDGCPKCGGTCKSNELDFINKSNIVHNNRYGYPLVDYKNNRTKVKIICPIHGIFEQIPNSHLLGNGCPICCESKGEFAIRKLLEQNNIIFISRKIFNDCKNINYLPFDFYLPNHNTCIEYDGIQHFKSIGFFGGDKSLTSLKERDDIKTKYCQQNNINLLRIRYNENVKEKLNNYLIGLT